MVRFSSLSHMETTQKSFFLCCVPHSWLECRPYVKHYFLKSNLVIFQNWPSGPKENVQKELKTTIKLFYSSIFTGNIGNGSQGQIMQIKIWKYVDKPHFIYHVILTSHRISSSQSLSWVSQSLSFIGENRKKSLLPQAKTGF